MLEVMVKVEMVAVLVLLGQRGGGRAGGSGGSVFSEGALPTIGVFPGGNVYGGVNWTAPDGGRISGCTPGNDYFTSRFSPCEDMGQQNSEIHRVMKSHKHLSLKEDTNLVLDIEITVVMVLVLNGGGGSGAAGGNAGGTVRGSGGGGASGYTSGDVTILTTQLGGNSSTNASITFEYYVPD